jgi:hypothetical protein
MTKAEDHDEWCTCVVRIGTTICIDPGDRFCGVALYTAEGECYATLLYDNEHDTLYGSLVHWLSNKVIAQGVLEEFRLYPDKMQQQGYSEMKTPEVIGVIKYLFGLAEIDLRMQGASIKKPSRAHMRAKGIKYVGGAVHEHDAEEHGYYFFNKDTITAAKPRRRA